MKSSCHEALFLCCALPYIIWWCDPTEKRKDEDYDDVVEEGLMEEVSSCLLCYSITSLLQMCVVTGCYSVTSLLQMCVVTGCYSVTSLLEVWVVTGCYSVTSLLQMCVVTSCYSVTSLLHVCVVIGCCCYSVTSLLQVCVVVGSTSGWQRSKRMWRPASPGICWLSLKSCRLMPSGSIFRRHVTIERWVNR